MMKLIVFVAAASVACGIQYDGLRVKFGWSDALADVEHFFNVPRTRKEAESLDWRRTERPDAFMQLDLKLYCPLHRGVCALYDMGDFVVGLLISLPIEDFEPPPPIKPEMRFFRWKPRLFDGERYGQREYWAIPQYFVSEESLKAGSGPQKENGATLQDGGVWVYGLDQRLLRIPLTEAELNTTDFKKQNCIPNMGTHYYYNMTPEMKCEKFLPWFVLTTYGEVIGTGFQFFGKLKNPQKGREWLEDTPSPKKSAQITIPNGPPCLYDWAETYGVVSLHIYYVDKPWKIRCKTGDSIKPAPVFDRMLLNGQRYASRISDEFKKLFSG